MLALSRCLGTALLLVASAGGARVRQKDGHAYMMEPSTKMLNHQATHEGVFAETYAAPGINEFPAPDVCRIGRGFSLHKGCMTTAAQKIRDIFTHRAPTTQVHSRDVSSTRDYENMVESITSAEGGGYGVTASASFEYLQKSEVTTNSKAVFIGASKQTKIEEVNDPYNMKLTRHAKKLLRTDPDRFLEIYGRSYVHAIKYGGSFLGSVTVNARDAKIGTDLNAFADISIDRGLFKAGGNQKLELAEKEAQGRVEVDADARWRGGADVKLDAHLPESVGTAFVKWQESVEQSPVALKVITRSWIESKDVQEIVYEAKKNKSKYQVFEPLHIKLSTYDRVSKERAKLLILQHSVAWAEGWDETTANSTFKSLLTEFQKKVDQHNDDLESLTEEDLMARQEEIDDNNFSWFKAADLMVEWERMTIQHRVPGGTWFGSARKIVIGGNKLTAELRNYKGQWKRACAILGERSVYDNLDGTLYERADGKLAVDGEYMLKQASTGRYLDAYTSCCKHGAVTNHYTNHANQKWILTWGGGYYTLKQKATGRALDAHICCGYEVVTRNETSQNQDWIMERGDVKNTVYLKQRSSTRYLDAHTGGTTGYIWDSETMGRTGTKNQQWTFERLKMNLPKYPECTQ